MKRYSICILGILFLLLGGCASHQALNEQASQYNDPKDPIESLNRTVWDFNYEVLDEYLLRPTAVAYAEYVPQFARTGLLNMALNLEEPMYSVNNLLQGKLEGSFVSLGRFLINSTVGLLGTIDIAEEIGLERKEESFGEVLGKWGVGTGAFLMLPAMGPNDVRSGVGDYIDNAYGPLDALSFYLTAIRIGIKTLDSRASLIQHEQQLKSSVDPYNFVKSSYFQNLEFKVNDGVAEKSNEEQDLEEDIDKFLEDL